MNRIKPGSELFQKLTELLQQRIGLNPESVGKQTLEHAVAHRLKALRLTNADEYVPRLARDSVEWSEFLEEIIVPESWFFRELTPFHCAREFTREAMSAENRPKSLRFLSIPCSRGEEPYSLAMTLLDAGLSKSQFEIVACDLSERSLEFARRGRYRAIAFRETDVVSRRLTHQNFQPLGEEWELNTKVRDAVKFKQANLALTDSFVGMGKFDFIFCRNVLIYLTEEVRQRTLAGFKRMLNPGGLLYLGHSECRLGPQAGAVIWKDQYPAAFTWSRTIKTDGLSTTDKTSFKPHVPVHPNTGRVSAAFPQNTAVSLTVTLTGLAAPVRTETIAPVAVTNYLPRAKELANSGKLDEAESLCQVMLQDQPTSADVYCLLGVIQQARGDLAQAEKHYHKSLFLEPDHVESLTHMLRLAQRRGDARQVANYQRRLSSSTRTNPG